jgi:hypothetical protein
LDYLESNWKLSKKKIFVTSPYFYFKSNLGSVSDLKKDFYFCDAFAEIINIIFKINDLQVEFKNLLRDTGKSRNLYFDTDFLDYLESNWKLSKKKIFVTSPYFYFDKDENIILTPLHKANKMGTSGRLEASLSGDKT